MARSLLAATALLLLAGCGLDWTVPEVDGAGGRSSASGSPWHAGNHGGGGDGGSSKTTADGTTATTTATSTTASAGGASTSSTVASTSSSGGAVQCDSGDSSQCGACEDCAAKGQCAAVAAACDANVQCNPLFDCYFGCDYPLCEGDCYNDYAGGVGAFEALASCLYCDVCVVSCGPTPRCL